MHAYECTHAGLRTCVHGYHTVCLCTCINLCTLCTHAFVYTKSIVCAERACMLARACIVTNLFSACVVLYTHVCMYVFLRQSVRLSFGPVTQS